MCIESVMLAKSTPLRAKPLKRCSERHRQRPGETLLQWRGKGTTTKVIRAVVRSSFAPERLRVEPSGAVLILRPVTAR